MCKFAIKVTIFSISVFILYVSLIIFQGNESSISDNLHYRIGSYGHMFTRLKDIKNYKDIQVLFVGSSHSYRGFDPRLFRDFGISSFNLGSSFQTPLQTKYLLERYLDSLKPKLVVLEVFPLIFCNDGVESSCDVIANSSYNWGIFKLVLNHDEKIVYNTFIYSLYKEIVFNEKNSFVEDTVKSYDRYIRGGYVEKSMNYSGDFEILQNYSTYLKKQYTAFYNVIKLLKSRNTKYLIVQAPVTKTQFLSYSQFSDFDARMKNYGKYYNLNEMLCLTDTLHFFDKDHLNQIGVDTVNKFIIGIIKEQLNSYE